MGTQKQGFPYVVQASFLKGRMTKFKACFCIEQACIRRHERSWSNPAFENFIGTIKLLNGYGHSDVVLILLEIDSQSRDTLIGNVKETIEKTEKDNSKHDFTMLFDNFGFSFISDTRRNDSATKVRADGELKKYKHKAKICLAMGRDVSDTRYLVNEYAYLDYEWKSNLILEETVKKYLRSGTQIKVD